MRSFLLLFLCSVIIPCFAKADIVPPSCTKLEEWVDKHVKTVILSRAPYHLKEQQIKQKEAETEVLFSDPVTLLVFGRAYTEWNPDEHKSILGQVTSCIQTAASNNNDAMARKLGHAQAELHTGKFKYKKQPNALNHDKSSISEVSCNAVFGWAEIFKEAEGLSTRERVDIMMSDTETQKVFEKPRSDWKLHDYKHVQEIITLCMRPDISNAPKKELTKAQSESMIPLGFVQTRLKQDISQLENPHKKTTSTGMKTKGR